MSVLFMAVSPLCYFASRFETLPRAMFFVMLDKKYGFIFLELNKHEMHTNRLWQNSANS